MRKEKDEITELFRTCLSDAGMTLRDGFWEKLEQDIPIACQQRRRSWFFRVAAVASVSLVLAMSSIAFWYFSPKEEIGEAFSKVSEMGRGVFEGDGISMNQLSLSVKPILPKPTPKPCGILSRHADDEDSISFTVSLSFSFSAVASSCNDYQNMFQGQKGYRKAGNTNIADSDFREQEYAINEPIQATVEKKRNWGIKFQTGTALPADKGAYKMPAFGGVTVEHKLNHCLAVESGLLYSNLRSKGQQLHYLGIPVKMNITLADTEKLDIYASLGGLADKCIAGAPDNSFKEEPIQLALTAGVGINYKINDRFSLFAEPGISHHFKTDSKLATVRTERATNFNLLCGLRMTY